jgi:hypothetical protein
MLSSQTMVKESEIFIKIDSHCIAQLAHVNSMLYDPIVKFIPVTIQRAVDNRIVKHDVRNLHNATRRDLRQ